MKTPITLTVHPIPGRKIPNGYGHMTEIKAKELPAPRAWRVKAKTILNTWPNVAAVVVTFSDGSEEKITWEQETSHHPASPTAKLLKELGKA